MMKRTHEYNMANMADINSDFSTRNNTSKWPRDVFRYRIHDDFKYL